MKKQNYLWSCAVAGFVLVSAASANAGNSSCCAASCASSCGASVAASPKVRGMLDERCRTQCAGPTIAASTTIAPHSAIAASPKVQQMLSKSALAADTQVVGEAAGYQPTGSDGITASPKVRSMLDERRQTVEIAPLK